MSKNSYATAFFIAAALLAAGAEVVFAQSEMDALMFEHTAGHADNRGRNKNAGKSESGINVKESLTDNLSANKDSESEEDEEEEQESWLKSLITKGTSELFKSQDARVQAVEKQRIEQILQNRKSNAANFDISGVKLRMSPKEVEDTLLKQGYRKITETLDVPNFIKWRSEELCRQHGVIGFERLNACATMVAKENGFQFVDRQVYNRYITRESIEVYFTSTFTDNLAFSIRYKSSVPFSDSKASKNVYLNNIKVFDFWRRIDLKYGAPDNESEVKWGLGGKKPYLKAGTGRLELTDPLLKDLDSARMLNEDTRFANTQYYTF